MHRMTQWKGSWRKECQKKKKIKKRRPDENNRQQTYQWSTAIKHKQCNNQKRIIPQRHTSCTLQSVTNITFVFSFKCSHSRVNLLRYTANCSATFMGLLLLTLRTGAVHLCPSTTITTTTQWPLHCGISASFVWKAHSCLTYCFLLTLRRQNTVSN